jgi:hypothetical protein
VSGAAEEAVLEEEEEELIDTERVSLEKWSPPSEDFSDDDDALTVILFS